jgi:uncharacterized protein involved in exopolysaccharide biosynthesis
MTQNQTESVSESTEIDTLEIEIKKFKSELDKCKEQIKLLMQSEKPSEGIFFAKEIFDKQQDKLRLEVEVELRQKKINRIKLGIAESQSPGNGFLF